MVRASCIVTHFPASATTGGSDVAYRYATYYTCVMLVVNSMWCACQPPAPMRARSDDDGSSGGDNTQ